MDPFGRYDRRSESGDFHRQRSQSAYGGERGYYDGYDHHRYHRLPPTYYHAYHHDGCIGVDRRSRRRLRNWLLMLVLAAVIGFLAYRRLGGIDLKSKVTESAIDNIIDEVMGKCITRPEMIIPPDATPKARSLVKPEKEKPPQPEERDLPESDPLDIPLVKEAGPIAAKKLAGALLAVEKEAIEQAIEDDDETDGLTKKVAIAKQAPPLEPIADLQKVLGVGEASLKALNEQIDELTKKLAAQSYMIDELHSGMEKREEHRRQQFTAESTLGQDMLRQLGIKSGAPSKQQQQQQPLSQGKSKEGPTPFTREVTFNYPPISTVVCNGVDTTDRVCKVKNLCYDPRHDRFFIFKDPQTIEMYVPKNRSYLVDSTSIDGHNKFIFDFAEVHPDAFRHKTVDMVDRPTFMISRFHALNIMHTIHDDFLGLYGLHRMFASNDDPDERFPFGRDNHIFFLDSFENIRYDYVFQFLTDNPLQFRQHLRDKRKLQGNPICFRDAIVGNSKIGSWYSYGFLEPQGPILNKTVSGLYVRDAARYLMNRMDLPTWDESVVRSTIQDLYLRKVRREREGQPHGKVPLVTDQMFITVFSRQIDRVIVNEAEMINGLQETFGLPVRTVRMEDMHIGQQAAILRSTAIAVGIHGSALILSVFLPPGAILIELYPYAIPAENYTPYKTMSNLPGMRLAYRSWTVQSLLFLVMFLIFARIKEQKITFHIRRSPLLVVGSHIFL